MQLGFFVRFFM